MEETNCVGKHMRSSSSRWQMACVWETDARWRPDSLVIY